MSVEVWGIMPKSQNDAEKVEEAVARMIEEHNNDPEAHLGTGQSIEVHRTQEMVDHPAGSFAVDKFAFARVIMTCFESLDAWTKFTTGTGTIESQLGSANLRTGSTSNSFSAINVVPDGFIGFNLAKAFFWRATLRYSSASGFNSYFGLGDIVDESDFNGFGFSLTNGDLSAWWANFEDIGTIPIDGIDPTIAHTYEVRYLPLPLQVEFYIDGNRVGFLDDFDSPEMTDPYATFTIRNTVSSLKTLYITDFMYQQER
jgi:hypothetical protein